MLCYITTLLGSILRKTIFGRVILESLQEKKGNDKFFLHVKQSKNDISPKCHLLAYHYMF